MENTKYVATHEYASFTASAFGRSMIYTLMSTFALIFFTDAVGIDPIQAGILILVARIFDAFNDPIMGIVVDKTQTKWGKFRPYLLFSPAIIAVSTCLLFLSPKYLGIVSEAGKLVFCYFTYILWGMCFTIQDVPFWSLSSAISPNDGERSKFISIARIGSTIGGIAPTLVVPMITDSLGLEKGYLIAGIVFGCVGSAISLLSFFGTKEKLILKSEPKSIKEIFKGFVTNKPLLIFILAALLASTVVMAQTSGTYISKYLYDTEKVVSEAGVVSYYILYPNGARSFITKGMFLTVMSVMIGIGMVPAMVLVPIARKKFSLKQIYIASMLFGVVASVILYFIGYDKLGVASIFVLLFFLILIGIPLGVFNCITYNFVADCTDYAEWKNGGQRIEGVSFAAQTLISKASAGVATLITSVMLTIIKYQEPLEIDGILVEQAQSASTRDGLFLMITLIPAAGMLLTCIPILFFDYTGKKKEKIRAELEVMRAERMAKLTGEGEAVVEKEATAESSDVEG